MEKVKYKVDFAKQGNSWDFSFALTSGPNGQSVITSHYDAHAIKRDGLFDSVIKLGKIVKWGLEASLRNCLEQEIPGPVFQGLVSSKLAFIPELGGKTRVIAILDFWSQQVLKPIHLQLMTILRMFDTDGAFNQNRAFKRAMTLSKGKKTFSFDLSSATDRFPREPQLSLLKAIFGSEIADLWYEIVINRPFAIIKDHSVVDNYRVNNVSMLLKWAVGQPLGAYSSWALFSLTHHIVIQYCASIIYPHFSKKDPMDLPFKDYVILGDDIVIWDERVASQYKLVLDELDVDINATKSIISNDISVGEFCKRLFRDGVEISPIPLSLFIAAKESLYNIPQLIEMVNERWNIIYLITEHWALDTYKIRNKHLFQVLLGFRQLINGFTCWPWCQVDRELALNGLKFYLSRVNLEKVSSLNMDTLNTALVGVLQPKVSTGKIYQGYEKSKLAVSVSLMRDEGLITKESHPLMLSTLYNYEMFRDQATDAADLHLVTKQDISKSLELAPLVDTMFGENYIKKARHIQSAELDLFFLKTKRRRMKQVMSLAADYYYRVIIPRVNKKAKLG
jgi:hypothetical protein